MPPADPPQRLARLALLTLAALALALLLAASGSLLGAAPAAPARPVDPGLSLGAAFVGGLLAGLSPCSAAIIPAFLAYGFETSGSRLEATYVFYLGLVTTFLPLGFATSLLAHALRGEASSLVAAGMGVALMALAVLTLFPRGPGAAAWGRSRAAQALLAAPGRATSPLSRAYLLGAVYGLATASCLSPILGGLVALAAGGGGPALGTIPLFLVFALGIAAPLFLAAASFDRWGRRAVRAWASGTIAVPGGGWRIPLPRAVTSGFLFVLGLLLLLTRGTVGLEGFYGRVGATEVAYEAALVALAHPGASAGVLVAFLAAVGFLAARRA